MKKAITSCVMVLLCHLSSFSQICEIDLGEDQRVCEFQDTLVGIPIGGTWDYFCADSTAIISFEVLNDSSTIVTFSQCGSYTFEYSYADSICSDSDTIQLDFENPAIVNYNVDIGLDLEYQDFDCQQDTSVACGPFSVIGEQPKPIWTFTPRSGSCNGNSFEVFISDSISNCIADTITITENSNTGAISEGNSNTFCQTDILTHEAGEITNDAFFQSIFQARNQGIDSLSNQCPYPNRCFIPHPLECIDTIIYDTLQLMIPVHLGGEWQVSQNNQLLPLDTNNVFTIDSTDYFLEVSPTPETYAATFDIQEINANGDTVFLSNPITIDFQWVENWTTDTVQHIDSTVIIKDSCCICGPIISYTHDPVPPAPEYDCPPFSVEFIPALLASSPEVICNDSIYVVVIELSRGIPPYQYTGMSGTLNGSTFTSDTLSIDSLFYEFEFIDSGSCEETVSGEICPCLWEGDTPSYELATSTDCESNSVGTVTVVGHPFDPISYPYQYSLDGINFQSEPIFDSLASGIYELSVKDSFNCTVTNDFIIENNDFENLAFNNAVTDFTICGNEDVLLEVILSPMDSTLQVLWDNGSIGFSQIVNHSGTYVAAINDLEECTTYTSTFNVEVIPLPSANSIKIPNAFTPDGDGTNDNYHPIIDEDFTVRNYSLSIFNRWGQRVFQSNDKNEVWKPENKSLMGVYVYMLNLELITCTGEVVYFKDSGDLTLIR